MPSRSISGMRACGSKPPFRPSLYCNVSSQTTPSRAPIAPIIGAIGARDGVVCDDTLQYSEGRKGGFDPHARIPDMDLDGIDAVFLYPSLGLSFGGVEDPQMVHA